jgi:hypothetical protein
LLGALMIAGHFVIPEVCPVAVVKVILKLGVRKMKIVLR